MSTTRAHVTGKCTACGSDHVLSVSLNMEDGGVQFWTCTLCEATSWQREGASLSRETALARIPRR